jgi:hypothetical protein
MICLSFHCSNIYAGGENPEKRARIRNQKTFLSNQRLFLSLEAIPSTIPKGIIHRGVSEEREGEAKERQVIKPTQRFS